MILFECRVGGAGLKASWSAFGLSVSGLEARGLGIRGNGSRACLLSSYEDFPTGTWGAFTTRAQS